MVLVEKKREKLNTHLKGIGDVPLEMTGREPLSFFEDWVPD